MISFYCAIFGLKRSEIVYCDISKYLLGCFRISKFVYLKHAFFDPEGATRLVICLKKIEVSDGAIELLTCWYTHFCGFMYTAYKAPRMCSLKHISITFLIHLLIPPFILPAEGALRRFLPCVSTSVCALSICPKGEHRRLNEYAQVVLEMAPFLKPLFHE